MSHNADGMGNILARPFTGRSADELADPNFFGNAQHGMDGLSIFSGPLVTDLGRIDQVVGITGRIETPTLDESLLGTPKR